MAETGRRAPLAPMVGTDETQAAETKMRRALGLATGSAAHTPQQRPEQARARHRFVQDGGVPVVMLNQKSEPEHNQLRERIASLEAALENERLAHQSTLKAIKDLEGQHTALQTRLVHADLAHKDALEQERHLRMAAQEALQEALAQSIPAPRRIRPTLPSPALGSVEAASGGLSSTDGVSSAPAEDVVAPLKRGRGRPRSATPPEPKPIRWWTPSYRTKGKL